MLAHGGGPKGSGLLTKPGQLGTVTEVKPLAAYRPRVPRIVNQSASCKVRICTDAADFLIQAVGQDLRSCRRPQASSPTTSRASH